jgi:hypothetical protein
VHVDDIEVAVAKELARLHEDQGVQVDTGCVALSGEAEAAAQLYELTVTNTTTICGAGHCNVVAFTSELIG